MADFASQSFDPYGITRNAAKDANLILRYRSSRPVLFCLRKRSIEFSYTVGNGAILLIFGDLGIINIWKK